MKMGLLWYDANSKRPVAKKIDEAAERYREKFGVAPNTCYVNPNDMVSHPSLRIVAKPIVQANHYLVGVDEDTSGTTSQSKSPAANCSGLSRRMKAKGAGRGEKPGKPSGKRLKLVKA